MGSRKRKTPIAPFPDHIDRNYFAAFVSGLTDGEGCFALLRLGKYKSCHAVFRLCLRADDLPGLELIRSFFGCGNIMSATKKKGNWNPSSAFLVSSLQDHLNVIIPHFDKYPLLFKKARDYEVWKKGIAVLVRANSRPYFMNERGGACKWLPEDKADFLACFHEIRSVRAYNSQFATMPMTFTDQLPLFPD